MPSIRCGHYLAAAIALDFACRVAGWAGHTIAFVCDILTAQLNRGRRSLDCAISCRLVAVQDQISFHSLPGTYYDPKRTLTQLIFFEVDRDHYFSGNGSVRSFFGTQAITGLVYVEAEYSGFT